MLLQRDIEEFERPRQGTGNAALRLEKGRAVLRDWEPIFECLLKVSASVVCIGGRALPCMQEAGSSVLILPLHACGIVAAFSHGRLVISLVSLV